MPKTIKPPHGISQAAKKLWRDLTKEYDISDPAGLAILAAGIHSFDRSAQAKKILDAEGPVVTDKFGQRKCHPAATVELSNRAAWLNAIRMLNLDVEVSNRGPGRPPANWQE